MDRQYNDQKKHGQTIQRPKETWTGNGRCIASPCFFWSLYCLSMFLLVVVLSVHVSFGRYNYQKKHGQKIQRPKETWTDNTTTKGNMDRQYNDQKKHGQTIQRPNETWTGLSMFLLVFVLSVNVSFGLCIACPCFFWSLYCLSIKETWTDNTTTKRSMDR
jgi:hypothetical protein